MKRSSRITKNERKLNEYFSAIERKFEPETEGSKRALTKLGEFLAAPFGAKSFAMVNDGRGKVSIDIETQSISCADCTFVHRDSLVVLENNERGKAALQPQRPQLYKRRTDGKASITTASTYVKDLVETSNSRGHILAQKVVDHSIGYWYPR